MDTLVLYFYLKIFQQNWHMQGGLRANYHFHSRKPRKTEILETYKLLWFHDMKQKMGNLKSQI